MSDSILEVGVPGIGGLMGAVITYHHMPAYGFDLEASEASVLKRFVTRQVLLLAILIKNEFRDVPLAVLVLAVWLDVYVAKK